MCHCNTELLVIAKIIIVYIPDLGIRYHRIRSISDSWSKHQVLVFVHIASSDKTV